MSYTRLLAEFATDASFADLPESTIVATKRLVLDTLGCTVGGRNVPSSLSMARVRTAFGGEGQATVLVGGERLPCPAVAAINSHYANALDAEETILHSGHLAASAVPPALAIAEWQRSSGRDLLTAVAVGFDVAARIGVSLRPIDVSDDGKVEISPVGGLSWAGFAATVATGRLIGLDRDQMAQAFGVTVALAPLPIGGRWGILASPRPMTKYGMYGAIGEAGVLGALLVQSGFEGDASILDGERGFWRINGSRRCDWDDLTDRLGKRWLGDETSYKMFPACQWAMPALDLFYGLTAQHDLAADEIEEVEVLVPEAAIVKAMDSNVVATVVDGQFSIPHLMGLAAHGGPPGPLWHTAEAITDPAVREFANRVRVGVNKDAEAILKALIEANGHAEAIPTVVNLVARGRTYSASADHAVGDAWAEGGVVSDEALTAKFRRFCEPYLPADQVTEAIGAVRALENEPTVDRLVACLVDPPM